MYLLLAGLMACTPTPEVGALDPSTVDPGQTVRVIGRSFTPEATVNLVSYSGESTGLAQINVASENIIEVTVPDGVTSGTYGVRISQGSKTAELVPELSVRTAQGELLCGKQRSVSEFSQVRKEVAIERFDPTRDPERVITKLPLKEIERIEYSVVSVQGRSCEVIRLKTTDGRLVVYADDDTLPLKDRAWSLAKTPWEAGRTGWRSPIVSFLTRAWSPARVHFLVAMFCPHCQRTGSHHLCPLVRRR